MKKDIKPLINPPSDDVAIRKLTKEERIKMRKWAKNALESGKIKPGNDSIDFDQIKKARKNEIEMNKKQMEDLNLEIESFENFKEQM